MKRILLLFTMIFSFFTYAQSDCTSALAVCGNSGISYTPTDSGNVDEDLGGCLLGDEHFSVWYSFTIAESGTLAFMISPEQNIDYDWAVYGPNVDCSNLGEPIRCNFSGISGDTGLTMDLIFPDDDGPFEGFMDVVAGETYYLVVDNWSAASAGAVNFTLEWEGTATLVSAFDEPSIQPNPFIPPGVNEDGIITICSSPELFDFSLLSEDIINGNPNFTITYHYDTNEALLLENPITEPIYVSAGETYFYTISYTDPDDPNSAINSCNRIGEITFVQGNIQTLDATLTACNNNDEGEALFNLEDAIIYGGNQPINTTFYPTLADLTAETNEITNPQTYTSGEGSVFVLVTTESGCFNSAEITLEFLPEVETVDQVLSTCFLPEEPSTGMFDLTNVFVTQDQTLTQEYFASEQDAIDGNNPIADPTAYISVSTDVFVRVTNQSGCFDVAKIELQVVPPTYSEYLQDKIVCVENTARLDAGLYFDEYLWSTGETTSFIDGATVGTYWVELTKNGCVTRQEVRVIAAPVPVIDEIKINNDTLEILVEGGTEPYQYSLDGVTWQESNLFENLPRGLTTVYVKDEYNCEPVIVVVTIPNLLNVITPNGDGYNDVLDYSALNYVDRMDFTVYDRYGNKVFDNTDSNTYTWNGKMKGGKNVPTGSYWYVITWLNATTGTPFTYKGWILVKNQ